MMEKVTNQWQHRQQQQQSEQLNSQPNLVLDIHDIGRGCARHFHPLCGLFAKRM